MILAVIRFSEARNNILAVLFMSTLFDIRKVKVLSLPKTIKEKSTFRAKALRRELVGWGGGGGGGRGKPRVFLYELIKTSRDKIKANQMNFIKTKCKQRNVNRIA